MGDQGEDAGETRSGDRASRRAPKRPRPLNTEALSELALAYVGRFATTRSKLARYLERKLRERGWESDTPADIQALVERVSHYGYVDDAAYAEATARRLTRRGFGMRRIGAALHAAGVKEDDSTVARQIGADERLQAALRLAERRRWGPFADEATRDPKVQQKRLATFLRAGHDAALARAILALRPGEDSGHLV